MKKFALAALILAYAFPVWGQEALQNGDFADGITHWHGEGRSPADFASDNPLQASDPLTSKGLIVPLKHTQWSKVAQDFRGHLTTGVLTVAFKVSPDFAFSDKPEDYSNVPSQLGWGWKPFGTPPGSWLLFISALGDTKGTYYPIKTKTGASDVQGFKFKITGLTPLDEQTITLAFPPGNGTIVILNVSISNQ